MFDTLGEVLKNSKLPAAAGNTGLLSDLIGIGLNVMMGVGFSISFLSIAYAGILYATTSGDPKKGLRAWNAFLWGVIAAMVSLGAVTIKTVVLKLAGVESDVPQF